MFNSIRKYLHENQEMITMGLLAYSNGSHIRAMDFQRVDR